MSDLISRQAITQVLNTMDRYVADELTLCDTDKKFPRNEVFIVDDVYENIIEQLPPADVRENIHGHIMETHFSDYELFKCSECGRRFFMQKSYGIYKACPFCMAIFDNGVDMRGKAE